MAKQAAQVQSLKPSPFIALLEPLSLLAVIVGCVLMISAINFAEDGFLQLADNVEADVDPTFLKPSARIMYYLPLIAIPFLILQTVSSNQKLLKIFAGSDVVWVILGLLPLIDLASNSAETNKRLDDLCPNGSSPSGVIQSGCNNVSQASTLATAGVVVYLLAQVMIIAATLLEIKHIRAHPRLKDYNGWALRPKPAKPQARAMLTKSVQMPKDSSPLHQAAAFGDVEAIQDAIKGDFELNGQLSSTGDTPLHLAAVANQLGAVKALLKGGANVNSTNKFGTTAAHIGAHYNNVELLKILTKNKADLKMRNQGGRTPLDNAVAQGNKQAEKYLRKFTKE